MTALRLRMGMPNELYRAHYGLVDRPASARKGSPKDNWNGADEDYLAGFRLLAADEPLFRNSTAEFLGKGGPLAFGH